MIPIRGLFETHLTVRDLDRSIAFYRDALGLPLATVVDTRRAAFFWIGGPGHAMLGIWETGPVVISLNLHFAFAVDLDDVLTAPARLRASGIEPLDFNGHSTNEPVVLAWMPAAAVYFRDPDGHSLELLAMLPEPGQPSRGVVSWSDWRRVREPAR